MNLKTQFAAKDGFETILTGEDEFEIRKFAENGGYDLYEQKVDADGVVMTEFLLRHCNPPFDDDYDDDDDEPEGAPNNNDLADGKNEGPAKS